LRFSAIVYDAAALGRNYEQPSSGASVDVAKLGLEPGQVVKCRVCKNFEPGNPQNTKWSICSMCYQTMLEFCEFRNGSMDEGGINKIVYLMLSVD
jgi:hypothetical protein